MEVDKQVSLGRLNKHLRLQANSGDCLIVEKVELDTDGSCRLDIVEKQSEVGVVIRCILDLGTVLPQHDPDPLLASIVADRLHRGPLVGPVRPAVVDRRVFESQASRTVNVLFLLLWRARVIAPPSPHGAAWLGVGQVRREEVRVGCGVQRRDDVTVDQLVECAGEEDDAPWGGEWEGKSDSLVGQIGTKCVVVGEGYVAHPRVLIQGSFGQQPIGERAGTRRDIMEDEWCAVQRPSTPRARRERAGRSRPKHAGVREQLIMAEFVAFEKPRRIVGREGEGKL
mmetsp:Transcript_32867/g.81402  ORF Transcript_32867/g.81402 Transcript_32867/m.81402 type:complete len:283 (+) Transcript_32867:552-1400(+)